MCTCNSPFVGDGFSCEGWWFVSNSQDNFSLSHSPRSMLIWSMSCQCHVYQRQYANYWRNMLMQFSICGRWIQLWSRLVVWIGQYSQIISLFHTSPRSMLVWSMWCQCHVYQSWCANYWRNVHMQFSICGQWIQLWNRLVVWIGQYSQIISLFHTVPDPCLSDPCDVNAICTRDNLRTTDLTCRCNFPFLGNGFSCEAGWWLNRSV